MVTKFVGQILATKFGFVPDWSDGIDIELLNDVCRYKSYSL